MARVVDVYVSAAEMGNFIKQPTTLVRLSEDLMRPTVCASKQGKTGNSLASALFIPTVDRPHTALTAEEHAQQSVLRQKRQDEDAAIDALAPQPLRSRHTGPTLAINPRSSWDRRRPLNSTYLDAEVAVLQRQLEEDSVREAVEGSMKQQATAIVKARNLPPHLAKKYGIPEVSVTSSTTSLSAPSSPTAALNRHVTMLGDLPEGLGGSARSSDGTSADGDTPNDGGGRAVPRSPEAGGLSVMLARSRVASPPRPGSAPFLNVTRDKAIKRITSHMVVPGPGRYYTNYTTQDKKVPGTFLTPHNTTVPRVATPKHAAPAARPASQPIVPTLRLPTPESRLATPDVGAAARSAVQTPSSAPHGAATPTPSAVFITAVPPTFPGADPADGDEPQSPTSSSSSKHHADDDGEGGGGAAGDGGELSSPQACASPKVVPAAAAPPDMRDWFRPDTPGTSAFKAPPRPSISAVTTASHLDGAYYREDYDKPLQRVHSCQARFAVQTRRIPPGVVTALPAALGPGSYSRDQLPTTRTGLHVAAGHKGIRNAPRFGKRTQSGASLTAKERRANVGLRQALWGLEDMRYPELMSVQLLHEQVRGLPAKGGAILTAHSTHRMPSPAASEDGDWRRNSWPLANNGSSSNKSRQAPDFYLGNDNVARYSSTGMVKRVPGGAMSPLTRMSQSVSLRAYCDGRIVPPAVCPPHNTGAENTYHPHDGVQAHRPRSPEWQLPPNRIAMTQRSMAPAAAVGYV